MLSPKAILDFFLPRICPACKCRLSPDEEVICDSCFANIKLTSRDFLQSEYLRKFADERIISGFTAPFIFENEKELQKLIHQLKYNDRFRVGFYLGKKISGMIKEELQSWNADYIIPIPLHGTKKASRGYNQALYIAKGISHELNIRVLTKGIRRVSNTQSQTKLNLEERRQNMESAFRINTDKVSGRKIILLDDVITTGSTIRSCAKELLNKGATKVYALSVAIADI